MPLVAHLWEESSGYICWYDQERGQCKAVNPKMGFQSLEAAKTSNFIKS